MVHLIIDSIGLQVQGVEEKEALEGEGTNRNEINSHTKKWPRTL